MEGRRGGREEGEKEGEEEGRYAVRRAKNPTVKLTIHTESDTMPSRRGVIEPLDLETVRHGLGHHHGRIQLPHPAITAPATISHHPKCPPPTVVGGRPPFPPPRWRWPSPLPRPSRLPWPAGRGAPAIQSRAKPPWSCRATLASGERGGSVLGGSCGWVVGWTKRVACHRSRG